MSSPVVTDAHWRQSSGSATRSEGNQESQKSRITTSSASSDLEASMCSFQTPFSGIPAHASLDDFGELEWVQARRFFSVPTDAVTWSSPLSLSCRTEKPYHSTSSAFDRQRALLARPAVALAWARGDAESGLQHHEGGEEHDGQHHDDAEARRAARGALLLAVAKAGSPEFPPSRAPCRARVSPAPRAPGAILMLRRKRKPIGRPPAVSTGERVAPRCPLGPLGSLGKAARDAHFQEAGLK